MRFISCCRCCCCSLCLVRRWWQTQQQLKMKMIAHTNQNPTEREKPTQTCHVYSWTPTTWIKWKCDCFAWYAKRNSHTVRNSLNKKNCARQYPCCLTLLACGDVTMCLLLTQTYHCRSHTVNIWFYHSETFSCLQYILYVCVALCIFWHKIDLIIIERSKSVLISLTTHWQTHSLS